MKVLLISLAFASTAIAGPRYYGMASLGEAPYQHLYDVGGSIPVFQYGVHIDYSTKFVTPYSKTTLGYYNHGIFAEEYVGIQLGAAIKWIKPALTTGFGLQMANEKVFTVGDEYKTNRVISQSLGSGLRVDVLEKAYGELDWRSGGVPWWKFEIGWRLF